jgi:hypothetical protein
MRDGTDVTGAFTRGAQEAINLARLAGATYTILKARSPSAGLAACYDAPSRRLKPDCMVSSPPFGAKTPVCQNGRGSVNLQAGR